MNFATMANDDTTLEATTLQNARELHNNGGRQCNVKGHNATKTKNNNSSFSHLLVVSSAFSFTPLLLFACGPLVLDSKRALHSLLYLCTHFSFFLSWEKMLVVRK
jgi:hypothetical protein